MRDNKIIYSITLADIKKVAKEYCFRELTDDELNIIIEALPEHNMWRDAIKDTIDNVFMEV